MPFQAAFETSSRCNFSCPMCPRTIIRSKQVGRDMTYGEFVETIDGLKEYLLFVVLWNYGEPLLNEDISRMIKYCSQDGIVTIISTNGSLLSRKMGEDLIASGLDYLIICFDGASSDIYKKYRVGGDFNQLKKNVKELCILRNKLKTRIPIIELQFIAMKENSSEIGDFLKLAEELGADRASVKKFGMFLSHDNSEFIPEDKRLAAEIFLQDKFPNKDFCEIPWRSLVINADGLVFPCCRDFSYRQKIGNAFVGDIKDIWKGNKYARFRERVREDINLVDICRDCHVMNGLDRFVETMNFGRKKDNWLIR